MVFVYSLPQARVAGAATPSDSYAVSVEATFTSALARFVMTLMQGMRVIGKGSDDPARLRDTAERALSVLA